MSEWPVCMYVYTIYLFLDFGSVGIYLYITPSEKKTKHYEVNW